MWATISVMQCHAHVHTCVLAHSVWIHCFIRPSGECGYHYTLRYNAYNSVHLDGIGREPAVRQTLDSGGQINALHIYIRTWGWGTYEV